MAPRKPRKPKPLSVGPVKARAIRGPHRDDRRRWYWQAIRYQDGAQRTVWTGWAARDELTQTLADLVASGAADVPRAPKEERADEVRTVGDLVEYWIGAQEDRSDLADATVTNLRQAARHVRDGMGDVLLTRVSAEVLERYRDERLRGGAATGTLKGEFAALSRAWLWGGARGFCDGRIRPPAIKHKPARERYTPTIEEVEAAAAAATIPWVREAILWYAATGARCMEIGRLTWDDVDLERAEIFVRGGKTPRTVIIPQSLVERLQAVPEEERRGPVLGTSSGNVRAMCAKFIRKACIAAGVHPFASHGIRRLVIDRYYAAGVDVGTVAAQVGQSPTVALQYYRQATTADRRRAVALAGLGEAGRANVVDFDRRRREEG